MGSSRQPISSSPTTGNPAARAPRATTGASCGTPGLLTTVRARRSSSTPVRGRVHRRRRPPRAPPRGIAATRPASHARDRLAPRARRASAAATPGAGEADDEERARAAAAGAWITACIQRERLTGVQPGRGARRRQRAPGPRAVPRTEAGRRSGVPGRAPSGAPAAPACVGARRRPRTRRAPRPARRASPPSPPTCTTPVAFGTLVTMLTFVRLALQVGPLLPSCCR